MVQIPAGYQSLDGTEETFYNDDGSIISNASVNEYNSSQLIKKTTRTGSDGSLLISEIKYPFDYPTDPVLSQMVVKPHTIWIVIFYLPSIKIPIFLTQFMTGSNVSNLPVFDDLDVKWCC